MSIGPSVCLSKDVSLLPPVSMAEEIEAGATIGDRTSLGPGCFVGERAMVEGTVVRNSIVGPGTIIHKGCMIRGLSVLGAQCVIEEGNVLDCAGLG